MVCLFEDAHVGPEARVGQRKTRHDALVKLVECEREAREVVVELWVRRPLRRLPEQLLAGESERVAARKRLHAFKQRPRVRLCSIAEGRERFVAEAQVRHTEWAALIVVVLYAHCLDRSLQSGSARSSLSSKQKQYFTQFVWNKS